MTGFWTDVQFCVFFSLNILVQTYFGMHLVFLMLSNEVADAAGMLVNSIFFICIGFKPPFNFG